MCTETHGTCSSSSCAVEWVSHPAACRLQRGSRRQQAVSDASFESAARVNRHRRAHTVLSFPRVVNVRDSLAEELIGVMRCTTVPEVETSTICSTVDLVEHTIQCPRTAWRRTSTREILRLYLWIGRLSEHQRCLQFERCVAEPLQTITAILRGSKWSCLLFRAV